MSDEVKARMAELLDQTRKRIVEIEDEVRALRAEQAHCKLIVASAEGKTTLKRARKAETEEAQA